MKGTSCGSRQRRRRKSIGGRDSGLDLPFCCVVVDRIVHWLKEC